MKIYGEAIAHVVKHRIEINLDDGVKVNYAKFQGIEVAQEGINNLDEAPKIYYSPQFGELVHKDSRVEIGISKISAGYQSLLWMIMDLAYRACLLNPEL